MDFIIYVLSDPRTGELRYVGKTHFTPQKRLRQHMEPGQRRPHTHKNHWLNSLADQGLKPTIEVVEELTAETVDDAERFHIVQFRALGFRLTNTTPGGEGQSRGWNPSPETRARMSQARQGKPMEMTPARLEHIATLAKVRKGQKMSLESRQKQSLVRRKIRPFVDQFGTVYQYAAQAAQALNLGRGNVYKVLTGKYRQTGGYVFRYLDAHQGEG